MNRLYSAIFVIAFSFFSANSMASIITWDFEFEVSFVEDRTNGAWSNPLIVGDIITASLSFDSNPTVLDDNALFTNFDVSNAAIDIASLTSEQWLDNLEPLAWVNHSPSRESGNIRSSYSIDNALTGEINWEALIINFIDNNAVQSYTNFPTDWDSFPVSFTYHRDLDANSSGSEVYITGEAISAVQRVPEPTTFALLSLFLVFLTIAKYMKKHKKSHDIYRVINSYD